MKIIYREGNMNDAADIAVLTCQLGYPVTTAAISANLKTVFEKSMGKLIVAEYNAKVVAWLHVQHRTSIESGNYCEIAGLVVDETHRNKGIGKVLVNKAKEWAKNTGVTKLRVRTNVKRHQAHQFYFREGFKEVKEQKSLEVIL